MSGANGVSSARRRLQPPSCPRIEKKKKQNEKCAAHGNLGSCGFSGVGRIEIHSEVLIVLLCFSRANFVVSNISALEFPKSLNEFILGKRKITTRRCGKAATRNSRSFCNKLNLFR